MLRANTVDGTDTYILESNNISDYVCPLCGANVFRKMGNGIRRPHFAHKSNPEGGANCDGWSSDMSEWHIAWQERFPVECREVVVEKDGKKHRADVFLKTGIVVEFQHSPISVEEFNERNKFYKDCGYKVIWLFDARKDWEEKRFLKSKDGGWIWKRPRDAIAKQGKSFFSFSDIDIYLEFGHEFSCIVKLMKYDRENQNAELSFDEVPRQMEWYAKAFSFSDLSFVHFICSMDRSISIETQYCPECNEKMRFTVGPYSPYYYCEKSKTLTNHKRKRTVSGLRVHMNNPHCNHCGCKLECYSDKIKCMRCGYEIKLA